MLENPSVSNIESSIDPKIGGVKGPFETSSSSAFGQILTNGFATITLESAHVRALENLYAEAEAFFVKDESTKLRYGTPNRVVGYRPPKYAHTGSIDKPDLNDSFLYWNDKRKSVPNSDELEPFLTAIEAYRAVAETIVTRVMESMRSHYDYPYDVPFGDASVMQINSFDVPTDERLLQHSHEDAVFLTVITANAPGLEGVQDDAAIPISVNPNEVTVMPGSVMTDMTGGEIRPFYHQVRNHGSMGRKSVMYFVSPEVTGPVTPYKITDHNRGMNIRDRIVNNPQRFGLSGDFI